MIVVRTTCSEAVGLGHYRRCATLAQEIRGRVVFALAADDAGFALARADGHEVVDAAALSLDGVRALIVDDYELSADEIAALHARVPNTLVLADRTERVLDVDAVLDANPAVAGYYEVPAHALLLLGARYALLRREFRDLPARHCEDRIDRVLITLGGSNPGGRTGPIAEKLLGALPSATVEVVAGPLFQGDLPEDPRLVVHRSPRDMVELMVRADLAIAAGGQTTYELAACGVPTVAVCVADNQRANLDALAHVLRVATDETLVDEVVALAADRAERQTRATAGQTLFDGRGAERAWRELSERWGIA